MAKSWIARRTGTRPEEVYDVTTLPEDKIEFGKGRPVLLVYVPPNKANARLIAAAPELLTAIGRVTTELAWLNNNGRIKANAPGRDRIEGYIKQAMAAIQKATEG